jgi:hypothetical protein
VLVPLARPDRLHRFDHHVELSWANGPFELEAGSLPHFPDAEAFDATHNRQGDLQPVTPFDAVPGLDHEAGAGNVRNDQPHVAERPVFSFDGVTNRITRFLALIGDGELRAHPDGPFGVAQRLALAAKLQRGVKGAG